MHILSLCSSVFELGAFGRGDGGRHSIRVVAVFSSSYMICTPRQMLQGDGAYETDKRIEFELDNLKGRDRIEDLDVGGRIRLKWILNRMGGPGLL